MAGKEKLLGIQYLRAIAALMVAYFHLTLEISAYTPYLRSTEWISTQYFAGAVPVFFVISGFVMYLTGIESAPGRFAHRRLARILPLYWILTLLVAGITVAAPHTLRHVIISANYLAKSLLFIPYWNPGEHGIFPILLPGWSLNFEMFFYAIFFAALFAPLRWRLYIVLAVLVSLLLAGRAFPALGGSPVGADYTSPSLALFALGIVIGAAFRRGWLCVPSWLASTTALIGFAGLVSIGIPGMLRSYVAPVMIVLGVVSLDFRGAIGQFPWLTRLGDASYSLYLGHLFAFDAIRKVWLHYGLHGAASAFAFASVCMVAALAFALLTYEIVEKPALALLGRSNQVRPFPSQAAEPTP